MAKTLVNGKLNRLTPEILSRAARKGDRLSLSLWREVGEWIGIALAGVVNTYNPGRIVILEFPDAESLTAFATLDEYAPVAEIRHRAADSKTFTVEGV